LKKEQLNQLLYEALETELGGVEVYKTALRCAVNEDLKKEWEEYLEQTENHVQVVRGVFEKLKLDPEKETPGRKVVRHIGQSLVKAMEMALGAGNPEAAQMVAAECVVEAETKDHLNWELLALVAEKTKGPESKIIQDAVDEVEEEEDEHLYHTTGWARELWVDSLGLPAALPPLKRRRMSKPRSEPPEPSRSGTRWSAKASRGLGGTPCQVLFVDAFDRLDSLRSLQAHVSRERPTVSHAMSNGAIAPNYWPWLKFLLPAVKILSRLKRIDPSAENSEAIWRESGRPRRNR